MKDERSGDGETCVEEINQEKKKREKKRMDTRKEGIIIIKNRKL